MNLPQITVHMIVKNEDVFLWYALSSILPFASNILLYDTGSSDNTTRIIRTFSSPKIIFEEKGNVNAKMLAQLRSEQIKRTKTKWLWVVDGDEIYPEDTIQEILALSANREFIGGVVRRHDLLGDIYHYQTENVGEYNLFGEKGHLVLRLVNKDSIPGMKVAGIYPNEGYVDGNGKPLISYTKNKFFFTKGRLFHATYLRRSSKGGNLADTLYRSKFKIESGRTFPHTQQYPSVFFLKKPDFVPSVTNKRSALFETAASMITPLKIFKRKLFV